MRTMFKKETPSKVRRFTYRCPDCKIVVATDEFERKEDRDGIPLPDEEFSYRCEKCARSRTTAGAGR